MSDCGTGPLFDRKKWSASQSVEDEDVAHFRVDDDGGSSALPGEESGLARLRP